MITNKKLESAFNVVVKYGFCGECRWKFDGKDCHKCDCYENGVKLIKAALEKPKDTDELEQSEKVVHGHWIEANDGTHYCSNCGHDAPFTWDDIDRNFMHSSDEVPDFTANYCYCCGAKMDEVSE